MPQLTYERCQEIFVNQLKTNYQLISPKSIDIDVDPNISQGTLQGVISGIQLTSERLNSNNGITSAINLAAIWGRTNHHVSRIDETGNAFGTEYIIHNYLPDPKDELFHVARTPGPIKYGFLSQTD